MVLAKVLLTLVSVVAALFIHTHIITPEPSGSIYDARTIIGTHTQKKLRETTVQIWTAAPL